MAIGFETAGPVIADFRQATRLRGHGGKSLFERPQPLPELVVIEVADFRLSLLVIPSVVPGQFGAEGRNLRRRALGIGRRKVGRGRRRGNESDNEDQTDGCRENPDPTGARKK